MRSFKQYVLDEAGKKTIYHGDNHNTKKLDPRLMSNGNNEEGVGIYFSDDLSVAEYYGKDIISAEINERDFIESRSPISDIGYNKVVKLMEELHKIDPEKFFYDLTDWGIELSEPEEVDSELIETLYHNTKSEQVRMWQVEMTEAFGVVEFVSLWNKHVGIKGTYYKLSSNTWYAIIDPKTRINKVQ